jgi:hypothetical protein
MNLGMVLRWTELDDLNTARQVEERQELKQLV